MLKDIDLTNKCGSCDHFRKIDGTAQGECLKNPYGENVVHDPKHPYWIVSRSRAKCRWYNAPPPTNADRIRAMSDEELMQFLFNEVSNNTTCSFCVPTMRTKCKCDGHCKNGILEWLKQPAKEVQK